MTCRSCNHVRDLDLCRDPYLEAGSSQAWGCSNQECHTEYDTEEIEQALVCAVQRSSMQYILQDLACAKCKGVKEANLSKYCLCAGGFTTTHAVQAVRQRLVTFRNIARHYKMEYLQETVEWTLRMNPVDE